MGIVCGIIIYLLVRCCYYRLLPTIPAVIECGFNGGGIVSGLFLILSVLWCLDNLVHIVSGRESLDLNDLWIRNSDGKFRHLSAHIEVTEVIAFHAFLGGVALIVACLLALIKVCRDAFQP
jgi:hypothetical protein